MNWSFNPHWHELIKQEKCSSLAPTRGIFYKTQWAWQGAKIPRLMSIFTSQKVWKFLIKTQLTKSDPKRTRGWKVPSLMPISVKSRSSGYISTQRQRCNKIIPILSKEAFTAYIDKTRFYLIRYWKFQRYDTKRKRPEST